MELLGGVHREATHEAADAGDRFAAQQCLLCQVRGASELESTHIHTSYLLDMIKRRSSVLVINVSTDGCFFKNVILVCFNSFILYFICLVGMCVLEAGVGSMEICSSAPIFWAAAGGRGPSTLGLLFTEQSEWMNEHSFLKENVLCVL